MSAKALLLPAADGSSAGAGACQQHRSAASRRTSPPQLFSFGTIPVEFPSLLVCIALSRVGCGACTCRAVRNVSFVQALPRCCTKRSRELVDM